ncbi:MAG: aspartate aminotransferase family protein [Cyclobacteriaceae bacterium]
MPTHRDLFLKHLAQTSDFPLSLEIESAEGVWMQGADGKKYIDLISGIGVSSVGHRHPKVVDAIKAQVDKHLHLMVYGEFVQSPQVQLAEALVKTLPPKLNNVYLVNSGSEANEGALKLAKRSTGRFEIISCFDAYHGSSHGALSVTGSEDFKQAFRPLLPGIKHFRFGQIDDLDLITTKTAAVIIETVQGEAGVRVASEEYWKALRNKCSANGALLILDEIQCGFGRTGKFWAFEHYDIEPDIITCAKGMGGGMPIGAFIANDELMGVFKNDPVLGHITTFGGHPVSAVASLATLEAIRKEGLLGDVEKKADMFQKHLDHPKIKEVRNKGLMMAAELESFETLKLIIDKAIEKGVLTDWFLFCDNSMRIAPPLTVSESEIEWACSRILNAIDEAS